MVILTLATYLTPHLPTPPPLPLSQHVGDLALVALERHDTLGAPFRVVPHPLALGRGLVADDGEVKAVFGNATAMVVGHDLATEPRRAALRICTDQRRALQRERVRLRKAVVYSAMQHRRRKLPLPNFVTVAAPGLDGPSFQRRIQEAVREVRQVLEPDTSAASTGPLAFDTRVEVSFEIEGDFDMDALEACVEASLLRNLLPAIGCDLWIRETTVAELTRSIP